MINSIEEESKYISRIRKGDSKAFEFIYHRYKEKVYLFSLKIIKSPELAEEIVHDAFLKVWEKRAMLNPDQSFNAFIHTICKNLVLNSLKKAAHSKALSEEIKNSYWLMQSSQEDEITSEEYRSLLLSALDKLPNKRKIIFQSCKLEGKSYQEVAEQYQISKNAVKDHVVKAGKFIKEFVLSKAELISTFLLIIHFI